MVTIMDDYCNVKKVLANYLVLPSFCSSFFFFSLFFFLFFFFLFFAEYYYQVLIKLFKYCCKQVGLFMKSFDEQL